MPAESIVNLDYIIIHIILKGIYPEFQVIRGFSQKIPAGLLSYDQIHSYLTFRVDIEGYFVELRQNDPSRNIRRLSEIRIREPNM